MTIAQKMRAADQLYAKEKYNQAKDVYEIITFESRGDTLIKKAQFRLAGSYYKLKLYEDAIYEYEELLRLYPLSQHAQNSLFMLGQCYYKLSNPPEYDQTETEGAIAYFTEYVNAYSETKNTQEAYEIIAECTDKLFEKKYENANLYFKMGYYNAALMYLKEILREDRTSEIDEKATVLTAKVYIKKEDWDSLKNLLERFKEKYEKNIYIKIIEEHLSEK